MNGRPFGQADSNYTPPLTKDLFWANPVTGRILDSYPGARTLAGSIRYDLQKGEGLESILLRLRDAEDLPRAQQFPEVPLFLQDLFGKISENYTSLPVNYARLADMLFKEDSGFESIAFVTLNYDTLLEKVLAPDYLGKPIGDMGSYITRRCLLVKLHGSVDWAERLDLNIVKPGIQAFSREEYLALIRARKNAGLRSARTGDISLRSPTNLWEDAPPPQPIEVYYPALSAPLGEYEPVCPSNHIDALKEFLSGCRNVLAIGVSGSGEDLLKLLEENLPQDVHSFWLIDQGEDNAERAYQNFVTRCSQLRMKFPRKALADGFTGFILSEDWGLEKFVTGSI